MPASYGPTAVGLMALHDRGFFEQLLTNPQAALAQKKHDLNLSPTDVSRVVDLINARKTHFPDVGETLAKWDRYHLTGIWDLVDWITGWTP